MKLNQLAIRKEFPLKKETLTLLSDIVIKEKDGFAYLGLNPSATPLRLKICPPVPLGRTS